MLSIVHIDDKYGLIRLDNLGIQNQNLLHIVIVSNYY